MAELISSDGGLELWRHERAGREFRAQIAATSFGSSGLRYRRLDVDRQIERIENASFLELRERDTLVATYVIARTPLRLGDRRIEGTYRGLLTVSPSRRAEGFGREMVTRALAYLGKGDASGGRLSWGCIDRNNKPSRQLLESLGAVCIGTLSTRLVYRQFPRRVEGSVEIIDQVLVERELEKAYEDCALRTTALPEASSTVPMIGLVNNGQIAAAARAEVVRLDLASVGSPWYARYGRLIDLLPPARKRFDPRDFRYLRLFDVIARPGSGHLWRDLLGDLLHRHDAHLAMFCLDDRSRVYSALAAEGLFGRLANATRQQVDVLGVAAGLDEDDLPALRDSPLALRAFDL